MVYRMPTPNPRVNVTLSPSLHGLVTRLAGLQRASKSQVLRELLEAAEPALQRAAVLMEAAEKATNEVKSGLRRSLDSAQDKVEKHVSAALATLDATADDLVAQAEAIRGRRPGRAVAGRPAPATVAKGASARLDPPASNRGVKTSGKRGQGRRSGGRS